MTGQVQGKVAPVTGGASGIGEAVAELLAREGASVAVTDIDDLKGPEVVAGIKKAGHEAVFLHQDVTSESRWVEVVTEVESFRDAPLGAGPESILPVVVMDSGLARSLSSGRALRGPVGAPRNDEKPSQKALRIDVDLELEIAFGLGAGRQPFAQIFRQIYVAQRFHQ
jgi:NAD(P)-dependent dehydrogenase (short-subunit alcohol dehydrogenase family)